MASRMAHKVMQARKGTPEGSGLLVIDNPNEMITVAGNNRKPRRGELLQNIGVMKEAALVIKKGIISEVGPRKEVLASIDTDDAIILDATGKTVMPGFVDPHTHLVFAGSRENELRWKIEAYRAQNGTYPRTFSALEKSGLISRPFLEEIQRFKFRYHLTESGDHYTLR